MRPAGGVSPGSVGEISPVASLTVPRVAWGLGRLWALMCGFETLMGGNVVVSCLVTRCIGEEKPERNLRCNGGYPRPTPVRASRSPTPSMIQSLQPMHTSRGQGGRMKPPTAPPAGIPHSARPVL